MKTTYVAWHPAYNNGKANIVFQARLPAGMRHDEVRSHMYNRHLNFPLCDVGENPGDRLRKIHFSEIKEYDTH